MRTTVRAHRSECTGCGACVSVCPNGAIAMRADREGFLYPAVDPALCIGCDLCEKRCPVGADHPQRPQTVLGAQNQNAQVRGESSSGGVFSALARMMTARGGVVFGAVFDEGMRVEHIGAFDESEYAAMRGSKYVQSDCTDAIINAKALLKMGNPVLFTGAPCQIDGLYASVGEKLAENLLTVDFVCHGVPSPGVFASYLKELEKKYGSRVTGYTFRDKRYGWKNFAAVAVFEDGQEHVGTQRDEPFLYGFLQNLYLRPSCVQCTQLRGNRRAADITIADLWGAQDVCPERDDDSGLSLVLVNSEKGRLALEACADQLVTFPVTTQDLLRYNPSIDRPAAAHRKRDVFFRRFEKSGFDSDMVMALLAPPGRLERALRRIAHLPRGAMRRLRTMMEKKPKEE